MLTRGDWLALWITCGQHHGYDFPLTKAVHGEYEAAPPEATDEERSAEK